MRTQSDYLARGVSPLSGRDLVEFEHTLKDALRTHVSFDSYSLYFPESLPEGVGGPEPSYRQGAGELLLPLVLDDRLLGWFVARGVKLSAPKSAPRYLAGLARAELEKLALYKRGISDPLTGLCNRDHFLDLLEREIGLVDQSLQAGGSVAEGFTSGLGVITLDLDRFMWINERYGYKVGDAIVKETGRTMQRICPQHAVAARLIHDRFAVLLPDARPKACFQLAELIRSGISRLVHEDEVTGDAISLTASLGHVNYPQGMSGPQLGRDASERARILLRKANKAVSTAKHHGRNRVFGFSDILAKGGKILEVLPMERLSVSLGRDVDARVGLRFLILPPGPPRSVMAELTEEERLSGSTPAMHKGEAVLIEVQEDMAFAEILYPADPSLPIVAGDRLVAVAEESTPFDQEPTGESMAYKDEVTGLYAHKEFMARLSALRRGPERFGVALFKILAGADGFPRGYEKAMRARMGIVAELMEARTGKEALGGEFGLGSVAWFLPGLDGPGAGKLLREVVEDAGRRGLELAAGVGVYPYMSFTRADMLENSRKALEHALLLPAPRAAVFDSISLNISADRLYMQGDMFAAVEEYKLSLLADEDNVLARNSLGICYAQLGRAEQARTQFAEALRAAPDDIMALYNLGWISQRLEDVRRAREYFERCLSLDPAHIYSMLRLGALAEQARDMDEAEAWYLKAAALPGGEPLTMRHLARIAVGRGQKERARECLHLALNANHNDHQAMFLLAKLYLDSGEDPQIAEVLARQCSALAPEKDEYWDLLVRALEVQGKDEEARSAATRKMAG
ncbi:MAG: diguanylate cyclase [Desulfovibrionaceae bacterium]